MALHFQACGGVKFVLLILTIVDKPSVVFCYCSNG